MSKIQFNAKVENIYDGDLVSYRRIKIPELTRHHCDMQSFRQHPKYGGFANSDLFPGVLRRIKGTVFNGREFIRLDAVPSGVTVDSTGFLANVSFEI